LLLCRSAVGRKTDQAGVRSLGTFVPYLNKAQADVRRNAGDLGVGDASQLKIGDRYDLTPGHRSFTQCGGGLAERGTHAFGPQLDDGVCAALDGERILARAVEGVRARARIDDDRAGQPSIRACPLPRGHQVRLRRREHRRCDCRHTQDQQPWIGKRPDLRCRCT
jgi:hypothetical protein